MHMHQTLINGIQILLALAQIGLIWDLDAQPKITSEVPQSVDPACDCAVIATRGSKQAKTRHD